MPTKCNPSLFDFARVEGRSVVASFDGGAITSDAGGLLRGATDRALRLVDRFAGCFRDARRGDLIEHNVHTLIGQRVFGIALGYEDLNDHETLRHDPIMAALADKLASRRKDCAPVAGKSTLNRLELSRAEPTRYHKISHDPAAIEGLFVDLFLEAYGRAPKQIILVLDATDDPLHGHQALLSRLLRLLLLPAALHLLRPAPLGRQVAPIEYRRQRRVGRGSGAHRRPHPRPLAAGAHPAARRLRVCP
jgi:hypothetical protein